MKDKNKKNITKPDDDKLHIGGNIIDNIKNSEKNRQAAEDIQEKEFENQIAAHQRQEEEERDRRLMEEKRELIRLKQGLIDESESTIHEEHEEHIELTFWQKIGDFFYHNKWWLWIAAVAAVFVCWFAVTMITKPRPDMTILVIGENSMLGEESGVGPYVAQFTEDNNKNGKKLVSVCYIPYSPDSENYTNAVDTRLSAMMQSAEAVIVLGNKDIYSAVVPEDVFADLSEIYPDNPHVDKYKFMLNDTDFAEKIGIDKSYLTDDWFLAIRIPHRLLYTSKEKMQEMYDRDFVVFDRLINDLT